MCQCPLCKGAACQAHAEVGSASAPKSRVSWKKRWGVWEAWLRRGEGQTGEAGRGPHSTRYRSGQRGKGLSPTEGQRSWARPPLPPALPWASLAPMAHMAIWLPQQHTPYSLPQSVFSFSCSPGPCPGGRGSLRHVSSFPFVSEPSPPRPGGNVRVHIFACAVCMHVCVCTRAGPALPVYVCVCVFCAHM